MHNGPLGKPRNARQTAVRQGEVDRFDALAKNQARMLILTKLQVESACATRPCSLQPSTARCATAMWSD
jgi:hypothetical protein